MFFASRRSSGERYGEGVMGTMAVVWSDIFWSHPVSRLVAASRSDSSPCPSATGDILVPRRLAMPILLASNSRLVRRTKRESAPPRRITEHVDHCDDKEPRKQGIEAL